jgi:hypothetical protein
VSRVPSQHACLLLRITTTGRWMRDGLGLYTEVSDTCSGLSCIRGSEDQRWVHKASDLFSRLRWRGDPGGNLEVPGRLPSDLA